MSSEFKLFDSKVFETASTNDAPGFLKLLKVYSRFLWEAAEEMGILLVTKGEIIEFYWSFLRSPPPMFASCDDLFKGRALRSRFYLFWPLSLFLRCKFKSTFDLLCVWLTIALFLKEELLMVCSLRALTLRLSLAYCESSLSLIRAGPIADDLVINCP